MGEFKTTFEKAPEKMSAGEFKTATVGLLNIIVDKQDTFEAAMLERFTAINGEVKAVRSHKLYFKIIGGATGGILLPVIVWLIIRSFGT